MNSSHIHNKQTTIKRVVTITLNPALDLTGNLALLSAGAVNLVDHSSLHAAGKGVNVAKVLSDLGAQVTVTGFLGRDNDDLFCQLFADMGATDAFIRVDGATRVNVKLVENSGRVSDINFPGITVSAQAIQAFELGLFELAKTHDYFVLAGSLPKGISPALSASWVAKLQKMGKKVLFDSSREALVAGIEAAPWLIKPNDDELSYFVNRDLNSPQACQQAVAELATKGISNIVLSLAEKGVIWLSKGTQGDTSWRYAQPPSMQVVSTVGAGDTLVAGFCWGHLQQWPADKIMTFSTALSALAVAQVGVGVANVEDVFALQNKVTLHNPLSPSL